MFDKFFEDLNAAKSGEAIVLNTFSGLTNDYTFTDVSNDRQCYYKGDIKATAADGKEIYIEVKTDSRIADTRNVLCEYEVYYANSGYYGKGNMYSDYDIYCIVSKDEQKIYVIDFSILKEKYKYGEHKVICHPAQTTYCYLCSLAQVKKWGALIDTINYKGAC